MIMQWDSLDQIKAWRDSAQYKEDRKIGDKYATFRIFAVEGPGE
jgi:heme-degrading monooxygenase HmoA